jgi:hypothetical protein
MYDSLSGYSTDFSSNGNVSGFDIYNNVYMYGCWNNVLFGTAMDRSCFIQRSNVFSSIEAEDYYYVEIVLKITPFDGDTHIPTTARIQWLRTDDSIWDDDKSVEFEINDEPNWHRYRINLGPSQWWQGHINNLRVYPFIDGHRKCKFGIKEISVVSPHKHTCKNTNCDYFLNYSHPCDGAGERSSCRAEYRESITTDIGSDSLIVNIDNFGNYEINLGKNNDISVDNMCKLIESKLSSISFGGYSLCDVVNDLGHIKIYSGTHGDRSSIVIIGGTASETLGFFNNGTDVSVYERGVEPASHYDCASSVSLNFTDISKMLGDNGSEAYLHTPDEYNIEAGNKEFFHYISSNREDKFSSPNHIGNANNAGSTIIDVSHPFTGSGLVTDMYINCGAIRGESFIYVLQPHLDGSYSPVSRVEIPEQIPGELYTVSHTTHHMKCHVRVCKGDVLAVYNANVAVSVGEKTGAIDACYFRISGKPNGIFRPEDPEATGVIGFHVYARSSRFQDSMILDIDFGSRVNADKFIIRGTEYTKSFEYNIAICEDVNWKVDCRNETHSHKVSLCAGAWQMHIHKNIHYGIECLNDGVISPDGGKQGTTFHGDNTGIVTEGQHSYFYVNGDAEWAIGAPGDGLGQSPIYEFTMPPYCQHLMGGFKTDPIHFILEFPSDVSTDIHKTALYFKDGRNFKHFSHQYYVSNETSQKTGKDVGYHFIDSYDKIMLDSIMYSPDDFGDGEINQNVAGYLFENPTAWVDPIYIDGKCTNWSIVQTAFDLSWNTMEHYFSAVECSGYRFIVDYHLSTKMSEFEVYSSFPVEPGLVDNAVLAVSTYGEHWEDVVFDYTENKDEISATVNISPRYFRLFLFSHDLFSLNNIEMTVTESVNVDGCQDTISIGKENDIRELEFTNSYGTVSDLLVSIPVDYTVENLKIADIKFGEENNGECSIYKNPDHVIQLKHGSIASNCNSYGLNNIVDGKTFYLEDSGNIKYGGVIEHGVSLDITYEVEDVSSYYIFDMVSNRYMVIKSTSYGNLNDINVYFKSSKVRCDILYNVTYYNGINGFKIVDDYLTILHTVFDNDMQYNVVHTDNFYGNDLVDSGNLRPILFKDSFIGIRKDFKMLNSFIFDASVNMECVNNNGLSVEFVMHNNTEKFSIVLKKVGYQISVSIVDTTTEYMNITTIKNYLNIHIERKASVLKVVLKDSSGISITNVTINDFCTFGVSTLDCLFVSDASSHNVTEDIGLSIDLLHLYIERAISEYEDIVVDFYGATEFDRVEIVNNDIQEVTLFHTRDFMILNSISVNTNFDKQYDSSFIIDMGSYHTMWFTRNYGEMANKLNISAYIEYSSNDTDDPELVDWGQNYDTSFIEFFGESGSSNYTDSVNKNRVFANYGTSISEYDKWCFFDGDSILSLLENGDFNFGSENFGIVVEFIVLEINTGSDLVSKFDTSLDIYSYRLYINSDAHIVIVVNGTDVLTSNICIESGVRYVVEVSRDNWSLLLFINGEMDTECSIGNDTIVGNTSPLKIGGPDLPMYGYLIKLRVRTGSNIHTSDYDTKEIQTTSSEVRWARIVIPRDTVCSIDKIGMYPDITVPINLYGNNCSWTDLGIDFTNYLNKPVNVSTQFYSVIATSFIYDCFPENAFNGSSKCTNFSQGWGFSPEDILPTIEVVFEDKYSIDSISIYHGTISDQNYCNNDFTIMAFTAASGVGTILSEIVGNTDDVTHHYFNPIEVEKVSISISKYSPGNSTIIGTDGVETTLSGGFIREIDIFSSSTENFFITSEDFPVVAIDLNYEYKVASHSFHSDCDDTWLGGVEDKSIFTYYASTGSDIDSIRFSRSSAKDIIAQTDKEFSSARNDFEIFSNVYLVEGAYSLTWSAYNSIGDGAFGIKVIGGDGQDLLPIIEEVGDWAPQINTIVVNKSGMYSFEFFLYKVDNSEIERIVSDIELSHTVEYVRWLCSVDESAKMFPDNNSVPHSLGFIKVLASGKFFPTEHAKWWDSRSQLSDDSINVVDGTSSLCVDYVSSTDQDYVSYIEADNFISDSVWLEHDMLCFNIFINDIENIDLTYGGVGFGNVDDNSPQEMSYGSVHIYGWKMDKLNLSSGWNLVKLKFSEHNDVYPFDKNLYADGRQLFSTNLRDAYLISFILYFRGTGLGDLKINIDKLSIKRCTYEETVNGNKALCISFGEFVEIPLSNLSIYKGTVSFTAKMYNDSSGKDLFNKYNSRTLFSILSSSNDIVTFGVKYANWFEFGVGNAWKDYLIFTIPESETVPVSTYIDYGEPFNVTVMWSNTGSGMKNNDTFRLYVNGELYWRSKETWDIKSYNVTKIVLGGGSSVMSFSNLSDGSAIFENIKVYNYCTECSDHNLHIENDIKEPNDYLYLSIDGVNFYDRHSKEMPITYPGVGPGETVKVYLKSVQDKEFKFVKNKSANLLVDWVVAV